MKGVNESEFNVLGCKVAFKPTVNGTGEAPYSIKDIVEYVLEEAQALRQKNSHLDDKQVATLLALQFAREKLTLEKELQDSLSHLRQSATEALQLIEEVCP